MKWDKQNTLWRQRFPQRQQLPSLIDDDGDGTRHSCCCPLDGKLNLIILWGQVE